MPGLALGLVLFAVTLAVRLYFDPYFTVPAIFIFGPAVVFSTVFGGLAGGIGSLVLSTLASWYFFLPPVQSWELSPDNVLAIAVYVLVFGADIALIEVVVRAYVQIQLERRRMSVGLRAANMGLWRRDVRSNKRFWSPEIYELFSYDPKTDTRDLTSMTDFMHPDDRERYRRTITSALADPGCDEYDLEYRILLRDGAVRWVRSRARITRLPDGTPRWLDGGVVDITRLKETERRLEILLLELQHRVKNFHAVVQAVAGRSLRGDQSLDKARELFLGRLQSLSRANIMLGNQEHRGLLLADVLKEELSAFSDQIEIDVGAILLKPNVAQSFALIVHELATNAVKHGALAQPDGKVALRGGIDGDGDAARFHFAWRELGGGSSPSEFKEGYGSSLLAVLCKGLGEPEWKLEPEGLRFNLICIPSELTAPADAGAPPRSGT